MLIFGSNFSSLTALSSLVALVHGTANTPSDDSREHVLSINHKAPLC